MTITLRAHGYEVEISPEFGAAVLRAEWLAPAGNRIRVLEPLPRPEDGKKAGCFVMAPFANRIDAGTFSFGGRDYEFPMNRPAENMACHGYARDHAWEAGDCTETSAVMRYRDSGRQFPWQFCLEQTVTLAPDGITIMLSLTHEGTEPLPYGMGLHPWFPKGTDTTLTFHSEGAFRTDTRGLPLPGTDAQPAFTQGQAQPLAEIPLFDRCFKAWVPCRAQIRSAAQGAEICLEAGGALRHLHVYVPDTRPVFCAEPVSHAPDVIHRPELGADAGMAVLAPRATMTGWMRLSARAI